MAGGVSFRRDGRGQGVPAGLGGDLLGQARQRLAQKRRLPLERRQAQASAAPAESPQD
ncbi:hypothetical protein SLITK23_69070 [Streptomyces lividans]|uniref:hypothetical protein n=1 Tax=Streptomyces TaxID=1883 RepID=UPI000B1E30E9|nr:hypothetical protein SLITK23_69070 [Streptomyces lividans]GHC35304.1 hypothetical protein GCM10010348_73190 [Streptomyces anthocyanicus]